MIVRWFVKIVVWLVVVGFIVSEVGPVVITRVQAPDIADRAAEEAGFTFFNSGSQDAAESRAREFVEGESRAELTGFSIDQGANQVVVSITKKASTRFIQKIGRLRSLTVVHATGKAPLRR